MWQEQGRSSSFGTGGHCSKILFNERIFTFTTDSNLKQASEIDHNIPIACLLNRSPVPAMGLQSNSQACDVTC